MERLARTHVFYAFGQTLDPALEIQSGDEILVETHDCFGDLIQSPTDSVSTLDWSRMNPATGPIALRGAQPGDTLAVDILDIQVGGQGVMAIIPDEGVLGDITTQAETRIIPIRAGQALVGGRVRLPIHPMIGVIGTTPSGAPAPTGTPGLHGGNMDCNLVAAGSTLYLPVQREGALLGLGDLHAVMGDGEIFVCGVEVPGEVRLRLRNLGPTALPMPFLENSEVVATIQSAATLDEASHAAVHAMAQFLTEMVGLTLNDAGILLSTAGNLKICQVVDPLKTVRMELPRHVLEQLGLDLRLALMKAY